MYADSLLSIHQIEMLLDRAYNTVHTAIRRCDRAFQRGFPAVWERLERAIDSIERLTGSPPAGYRSPSWDYYPPLAFSGQRGYTPGVAVFKDWTVQFDHAPDDGVFVLTTHPQVIGREDRLAKLGEFVDHARDAGAEFRTVRAVADEHG